MFTCILDNRLCDGVFVEFFENLVAICLFFTPFCFLLQYGVCGVCSVCIVCSVCEVVAQIHHMNIFTCVCVVCCPRPHPIKSSKIHYICALFFIKV